MGFTDIKSFFSVGIDFVVIGDPIPYDLYVNSSSHNINDRFIRIFPEQGILTDSDIKRFKKKYHQLYIMEGQRNEYLKSLVKSSDVSDTKKGEVIRDSAISYLTKIFDEKKEFNTDFLEQAIDGCRETVESMVEVVQNYSISQIQEMIASLSFHDFYTYDHSINVSMYCIAILKADNPKTSKDDMRLIGLAGLLHDLGKLKIPTHILNNPGKLSDEEFALIKEHPDNGKKLLLEKDFESDEVDFEVIARLVNEHHENFDGTGYPNGLKGEAIHYYARICAIADVYDAVTTKRSYQDVLGTDEAINVLSQYSGKRFDPVIFDNFVKSLNKIVQKRYITKELPVDFDPSSPHEKLPLMKVKARVLDKDISKKDKADFGKVQVQTGKGSKTKD